MCSLSLEGNGTCSGGDAFSLVNERHLSNVVDVSFDDFCFGNLSVSLANVLAVSRIGRYPVQRQRFPSKDSSISCMVSDESFFDVTVP